ncbi:MAG: bifunctional 2-methylcitrate synthase/citrate synthase [Nitrospinota bacterium]
MSKDQSATGSGLRGQSAGVTSICTVGKTGSGLTYRGFDLSDLAKNATFEEVAYLLIYDKIATSEELLAYKNKLKGLRTLPDPLKVVLEQFPKTAHPMDVIRSGCSALGILEPEENFSQQYDKTDRMLAIFPSIVNYWYHYSNNGKRIETETDDDTVGSHFLSLLHGRKPTELEEKVMNVSLILYAEHEFNASTFSARLTASTLSDIFSAVTAAIGTLRGPLHGGANEAALDMILQWKSKEEAEAGILKILETKDLVMGFGHAVYKEFDPRNPIIKEYSKELSQSHPESYLYDVSERVEMVMKREKGLFANADFYHASAYRFMNIPIELFTPIFVCSRVTGWTAHIFEQRANNKLIRPSADYNGPEPREWVSLESRG